MKILYFHQHFTTPEGSTGTRSFSNSMQLIKNGHKVTLVCGSFVGANTGLRGSFQRGQRRGDVDGIDVIELDLSYGNKDGFIKRTYIMFRYFLKAIKYVFTEDYDLVFATSTPLTASIPGIVAKIFKRKPFVFEVRDLWPELPREMGVIKNPIVLYLMSVLEYLSYTSSDHLIALSPGILEGIHKRGVSRKDITMIPNGCDMEIFKKNPSLSWRPESCKKEDFLAIFSGTHGVANNVESIINAAKVLQSRKNTNVKIILIGQGGKKADLIKIVKKENLKNIIFLDPVSKLKLAGLMGSADIGLQVLANVPAFYYGTSPNKFFDYIAAGLPVINNYPGWLANLITENLCGYAIPPEDPEKFADTLEHAATNKELLAEMGSNAEELAKAKFDRQNLAKIWTETLEGVQKKYD